MMKTHQLTHHIESHQLSELSASAPSNRHHHLQQDLRVSPVRVQSVKKQICSLESAVKWNHKMKSCKSCMKFMTELCHCHCHAWWSWSWMQCDSIQKKWQLLQVFKSNLFQNVFFTTHCCLICLPLRHRIVTIICSKTWESVQSEFSQWKTICSLESAVKWNHKMKSCKSCMKFMTELCHCHCHAWWSWSWTQCDSIQKKWQLLQVFKSNMFQNVFFTTHWHPRGHVMPLKLGLAAAAAFRTRTPASHFKKVQNCFCLDQDLPLGTSNLCRLAQLASCSCSGSGRRRRTERKEMMDWAYWNGLGCPLASNSLATSWVNNINFWSKRWFSAAFKVGSGSGVSSAGGSSAAGGSPGRCSESEDGEVSGGGPSLTKKRTLSNRPTWQVPCSRLRPTCSKVSLQRCILYASTGTECGSGWSVPK